MRETFPDSLRRIAAVPKNTYDALKCIAALVGTLPVHHNANANNLLLSTVSRSVQYESIVVTSPIYRTRSFMERAPSGKSC